ncbi:MAG: fumarate reductase (CoM/CoB) subunit [Clostridiales bacterium]|jgi:fumarate reductase (CoM/CoB) subunit A|nr:fumarate reductase (CoM/CoB) subunit [Clostridiales bacterium]
MGINSTIDTDVLVIGGGTAGAVAAIEAKKITNKVIVVSKGIVGKSGNTPMAEGGIQASFHIEDSPDDHFNDTMDAGRYVNDPSLVETLVTQAPNCIRALERYGVRFKKLPDEGFFQYKTSGSSHPRCLWIIGGGVGLVQPLFKTVRKLGVSIIEDVMITKILTSDNLVNGACGIDFKTGEFLNIKAKSIVIAAGGNESLYRISDGSLDASGDGAVLAYNAGAQLIDMEFIQFYPHALVYPESLKGVIIPEEVYYKDLVGGKLINGLRKEFAGKYDPIRKENTTRDILARAVFTEIAEGRGTQHGGVIIDLTRGNKERMMEILPALYNYLLMNGIDMFTEEVEVAPSAHYQCGGIKINKKAETTIEGLYAAGECTGGIDGANRLSSNALTEAVVFGMIAGKNAAENALKVRNVHIDEKQAVSEYFMFDEILKRDIDGGFDVMDIKKEIQRLMFDKVGVVRRKEELAQVIERLQEIKNDKLGQICLRNRGKIYNIEMLEYFELCNLIENAIIVTKTAQYRDESRGSHFRADCPNEDNVNWKKNIIVQKHGNDARLF